ncbi:MAG: S1 family peptidase, partial [Mycobacteriaceae bacterium]
LCTTGFAVVSATGQPGFATAGHCGAPGDPVQTPHGEALGTIAASAFPGTDYGWVATNSQYGTVAAVTMPTGAVAAVRGAVPAAVGAPVCVLGQASGWHCGTITATDQTVQYDQGVVSGLTATSVCSDAGDSGGVLISGDQAQGVVSGGIGDCSDNGTTYFQPLAPILTAYGLTLRTG